MSITAEEKARVMKEYATKDGDTGSPEVQVAILSSRIATLTEHFKTHKKDNHSHDPYKRKEQKYIYENLDDSSDPFYYDGGDGGKSYYARRNYGQNEHYWGDKYHGSGSDSDHGYYHKSEQSYYYDVVYSDSCSSCSVSHPSVSTVFDEDFLYIRYPDPTVSESGSESTVYNKKAMCARANMTGANGSRVYGHVDFRQESIYDSDYKKGVKIIAELNNVW